jgi:hypothetical protein
MTGVLVVALALIVAAVAAVAWSAARGLAFYLRCWVRLTALCVSLGVYDSHRQAERASHTSGGHRTAPPERGSVWPSLATLDRLPVRYRIVGRIVQHDDRLDQLTAQFQHFTGRAWTWRRRPLSRVIELAQAPVLPEIPLHPEPMTLAPWILPVGDTTSGPALWDVTTAYHRLTVGRTGSRKSSHAAWLARYCRGLHRWTVIQIDPEYADPPAWHAALKRLDAELETRRPDVAYLDRYLVQIDEFDDVMDDAKTDDHPAERAQCRRLVRKLLRHGGKRGFHVDAYAQDPRAKTLGPGIRSKFGARAALALDHAEIPLVLNQTVPYAPDQPGRGWFSVPGARPADTRFHTEPIQQPQPNSHPADQEPPTTTVRRIYPPL